ncbi:hypothetical protein AHF37_11602 [Paragonimus kellicotti]|nr:hypothetical protein AHF37_11602 [Paragonimus kellicotti]
MKDLKMPAENSTSDNLRRAFSELDSKLAWRPVILNVVRKYHPEIPNNPKTTLFTYPVRAGKSALEPSYNASAQDVHLLLLKVDMLEKILRSKSGVDCSPNDDTKSLACLPFMAPYRTLTDFDTGEVILMSEEKKENSGT